MSQTCFVLPGGMELGGVTTWSIRMAAALAARGRQATLIEHVCPLTEWTEPIPDNVSLLKHRGRRPALALHSDIRDYVETYQHTLPCTLVPNYTPGAYAASAMLARRYPSQVRVVGMAHTDQPYYYDLLEHYEPIVHRFIAVSHEVANKLGTRLPHRQDDIEIRACGVDIPGELRRTYSPVGKPLQLVFAGRLAEKQKCVSELVRLVESLLARSVDFHLRIVGDGAGKGLVAAGIRRLGPEAESRVQLTGRVFANQMPGIWESADVCVLVSEYEGTSVSMLEAMAQGCVPVVTRVSGAATLIVPSCNGFLSEVGDPGTMADSLLSLDRDRARLAAVGLDAYRTASAGYCFRSYVDWFADVSRQVWREPPRPWTSRFSTPLLPACHYEEDS